MSDLRLTKLLEEELLDIHYQPIVDLRTGDVFAYEALSRPGSAFGTPQKLIQAAVDAGEIGRLGRLQREVAVAGAAGWPIFLNIEPTEFDHGWLVRPDDPIFRHNRQVYLEITETVPLKFFQHCHSVLAEVRKKGVRLAIDDLGAGFSNLKYISELEPEIVKLDRELILGCAPASRELGLLVSITELCHEMNAEVVAEGVETLEELDAVIEAGVDYGQGNLFAPPAPGLRGIGRPGELSRDRLLDLIAAARTKRQNPAEPEATPEPEAPLEEQQQERIIEAGIKENTRELRVKLRQTARELAEAQRLRESLEGRLEAAASLTGLRDDTADQAPPPARRPRSLPVLIGTAILALLVGALLGGLVWQGAAGERPAVATQPQSPAAVTQLATPAAAVDPPNPASAAPTSAASAPPLAATPPPDSPRSAPPVTASAETEPDAAEPRPVAEQPAGQLSQQQLLAVVAAIEGWAGAWSQQRPDQYLAYYSDRFIPPDGQSRSVWQRQRRDRITSPSRIRITLGPLEIVGLLSGGARATFEQTYESESYRDQVVKTLDLIEEDARWRIVAETSVPI